jgi:hypothetical protein
MKVINNAMLAALRSGSYIEHIECHYTLYNCDELVNLLIIILIYINVIKLSIITFRCITLPNYTYA